MNGSLAPSVLQPSNAPQTNPQTKSQSQSNPKSNPSGAQASKPAPLIRESASEISVPRGGRNWFLIVFLFLVDLGLAGAGIYLLQRGLVRDDEIPTVGSGANP